MTTMRRFGLAVTIVVCFQAAAEATWSVIALDRKSRVVVIASATCVAQRALEGFPAKDLRDVQAIVVPGKGVAAAQARVDSTRANQRLIFDELQKGTEPEKILELLKADPAIEGRQFAQAEMEADVEAAAAVPHTRLLECSGVAQSQRGGALQLLMPAFDLRDVVHHW